MDDKPGGEEISSLQSFLYTVTAILMKGTKFKLNPLCLLFSWLSFIPTYQIQFYKVSVSLPPNLAHSLQQQYKDSTFKIISIKNYN